MDSWVVIYGNLQDMTTKRVLTMEFVQGYKVCLLIAFIGCRMYIQ